MTPTFSVVLAAYNRSRHIIPTIRSILGQSFQDFELIVVGDACTDDTERVVRGFRSERVRWLNLPRRSGSQAGPNNAGIELARGRHVAYIGHDDVWTADHLATLHRCFLQHPGAAFAIAGCIYYGPPGSGFYIVTGMFDSADDQAPRSHFFPPSSIAHRREVTSAIGPWRKSEEECAPVDAEFSLRAVNAGLRFHPTGQVTVHKFAGGHRYLSYLQMDSSEQIQLMRMMSEPTFPTFVSDVVQRSRETGRYMIARHPDYARYAPGEIAKANRESKGLLRPPLMRLDGQAVMPPIDDNRALDWRTLAAVGLRRFRWSGPNPRPRILIPFTADGRTRLRFVISDTSDVAVVEKLRVTINGVPVAVLVKPFGARQAVLECQARLPAESHTIVEFDLTSRAALEELLQCVAGRPERIALAEIGLKPRRSSRSSGVASGWRTPALDLFRGLTKH